MIWSDRPVPARRAPAGVRDPRVCGPERAPMPPAPKGRALSHGPGGVQWDTPLHESCPFAAKGRAGPACPCPTVFLSWEMPL